MFYELQAYILDVAKNLIGLALALLLNTRLTKRILKLSLNCEFDE